MAKGNLQPKDELVDSVADDQLEGVMEYSEDINEAGRPVPLPIGEDPATTIRAVKKVGKESGNPYLEVTFQVDGSDMPADYVEKYQEDKKVLIYRPQVLADTPKARYNMKVFCEAIGAPMSRRINFTEFTGLTCKIAVDHQDGLDGSPQENVRRAIRA